MIEGAQQRGQRARGQSNDHSADRGHGSGHEVHVAVWSGGHAVRDGRGYHLRAEELRSHDQATARMGAAGEENRRRRVQPNKGHDKMAA